VSPQILERYREIVPDWRAFLDASLSPEPATLRVRRGLVDRDVLKGRLEARGFRVDPVPFLDDYLQVVDGPDSVAQTLEHWLGQLHIQQAVMALPSLALAPQPGERVLDLCAAPGGKTAHMAELMEDRGPLVAVDPKEKRLRGLMANVFRLGHSNVLVIASDGRELPAGARFDRVLVDAPCSAEGNFRRQEGDLPTPTARFRSYVTGLQKALLRRAIELTRPGGTIVYSTCTFAPEENEAVVAAALTEGRVELETVPLEVPHEPGLTHWEGRDFPPEMRRAWRVYPHHLDSGGMFMARLRRRSASPDSEEDPAPDGDGWTPVPPAFPGEDEDAALRRIATAERLLREEYGFPEPLLDRLGWMVRKDNIWVQTAGEWPVERWRDHGRWRVVAAGLRAFREAGPGKETPSNQFLGRFHAAVGGPRRRDLTDTELSRLLAGEALDPGELPAGPIVLFHGGTLLGRGMVGRAGLRHEIPSHQARRLKAVLDATGR
jgi:NOL1/NOP2/sun family putative RNA methylase